MGLALVFYSSGAVVPAGIGVGYSRRILFIMSSEVVIGTTMVHGWLRTAAPVAVARPAFPPELQ